MIESTPPVLPGHRVLSLLGRGSSGAVWHTRTATGDVAVKVFEGDHAVSGRGEWRAMRAHAGPHVVAIHDLLQDEVGRTCLVMELMDGGCLETVVLGRGGLTVGECITALAPLARALAGMHEQGSLHGDLTPRNVLFSATGKPVLGDLGAVKVIATRSPAEWVSDGYTAPEVLDADKPTAAADVYALGALLWFCLTGTAPPPSVLRSRLSEEVASAPRAIADLVTACLQADPARRPDCLAFAERLTAIAAARPVPIEPHAPGRQAQGELSAANQSLTRRLREDAERRQAARPPQRSVAAVQRRSVLRRSDAPAGISRAAGPPRRRRMRVGAVVAAVSAIGAAGSGILLAHPGSASAAAVQPAPTTAVTTAPNTTRPTNGTGAPAARSGGSDDAAIAQPVRLLGGLLDCRSQAWNAGDATKLSGCLEPGREAMNQDTVALVEAGAAHVDYTGVAYTVRSARVVACARPGSREVCFDVVVTTAPVTAKQPHAKTSTTPARTDAVHVILHHMDQGWRIRLWSIS